MNTTSVATGNSFSLGGCWSGAGGFRTRLILPVPCLWHLQATNAAGAPNVWDFRASASDDGRSIVFCRAETGGLLGLWMMDSDGRHARLLTRGIDDKGADHPRWLPGGRARTFSKDHA